jgi:hypothetical protein
VSLEPNSRLETAILVLGFAAALAAGVFAYQVGGPYGDRGRQDPRVQRTVNAETGKVTSVAFDADGDRRIDRWCAMDGERLLWMDVDENGDGVPDVREYYGPGLKLDRTEPLVHGRLVGAGPAGAK